MRPPRPASSPTIDRRRGPRGGAGASCTARTRADAPARRRSSAAAALLGARGAPAPRRRRRRATARDVAILNFALTARGAAGRRSTRRSSATRSSTASSRARLGHGRRARARAREGASAASLGSKAVKRPHFDFGGATEGSERVPRARRWPSRTSRSPPTRARRRTSTSRAYLVLGAVHPLRRGAPRRLDPPAGRHARPVQAAFDEPLTRPHSRSGIVARTRFVMRTTKPQGRPKFTG